MADPHQQKPTILLLSLSRETTTHIDGLHFPLLRETIGMLQEKALIKRATSLSGALKYLNHNRPDGILVADDSLMLECNKELLGRTVAFAQYGGTVVFGLLFADNVDYHGVEGLNRFWEESWGLPWKVREAVNDSGLLRLNMFALNTPNAPGSQEISQVYNLAWLLPRYEQVTTALLYNVPKEHCWYFRTDDLHYDIQCVYNSDPVIDHSETVVAMSRVGDGYVGFIGGNGLEIGTSLVLMRMFKLPRQKHAIEDV